MQKLIFSIIIPVYNTAKYLPECLDSILCQEVKNYEIICVDNSSTDNSRQVLDNYAMRHPCIKILTENVMGAGNARNKALQNAKGEYVCFVDSDDLVSPSLLSECYKQTVNKPDIIIFGVKTLKADKIKAGQYSSNKFPKSFSTKKIFNFHTIAYNKIYKNSFLKQNNIQFGITKTGEDQIFTIKSLLLAKSIKILKKDLYIYRRDRQGALTQNKVKKDLSPIVTTYLIENFLTENNIEHNICEKILSRYVLKAVSWYGKTDKTFLNIYFKELSELIEFIKKRNGRYWWDYFEMQANYSYWDLKIRYINAFILYFLHEKSFIIPAGILFFIDTIIETFNKFQYHEQKKFKPKIKSKFETLQILIDSEYSICRFGDGEFKLIFGKDIGFQKYTKALSERLQKILISSDPNILIGIPDKFGELKKFNFETASYWHKFLTKNRDKICKLIDLEKQYFCAEVSRPYIEERDKSLCKEFFNDLKKIWQNKTIILVEGKYSRLGYNNDLFNNAKSINRIICPAQNAFGIYDEILNNCRQYSKNYLFIIALGPTATILAYDLAKEGFRALDMGHIDIEYEWFLRGANKKIAIENKYVNEAKRGKISNDLLDKNFENEILLDLTQIKEVKQND